uniref:ribosomal protein L9 n=1 Tax=Catenella fusiformis TaxID=3024791 RepID=UPI0027DA678B|nr:ribosomal protein L9 [Catenella fusiformis]WCH57603.1 ribosomal protein L9 [Catenella fusiformis]
MSKQTIIILKETKNKIGSKDDIITVKRGYAFNYLIPQNIAELATLGKIKQLKVFKKAKEQQEEKLKRQSDTTISILQIITKLNIKKRIGENKQIFGRVNEKEILKQIVKHINHQLDKKNIHIPEIKRIGVYIIKIYLFSSLTANLQLNIIPEITEVNI